MVIIVAIGTLVAWGTIVEAMYQDAKIAGELVYHSPLSYFIFGLFALNLTAVIADRYPWKKHHIGFISAHVGILILLAGSLVTKYFGVDGSISLDIGGKGNQITVSETDLAVYTSLNGEQFKEFFRMTPNFLRNPPTEKNPVKIPFPSGDVLITDFYPYALVDSKVVESDNPDDGPAVRFQIVNDRVMQSEWIVGKKNQMAEMPLGPARVVLSSKPYTYMGGNVLVLRPIDKQSLAYEVYLDRERKMIQKGQVKPGDKFQMGWMNFEFRLLKYLPQSRQKVSFVKREQSSPEAVSAFKFKYKDQEHWLGLNSMVRLFGESEMYVVTYGNRRIPMNFDMELRKFEVGRYQGTMRAASYQSLVHIPEAQKDVLISMNEPLDYKGFTFYQASFQEDEMGRPVASVLSVNFDPGRPWKYLGSLLIVFGSIHLFYRRWKKARTADA